MTSVSTVDLPGFLSALFEAATDGLCLVAPDGTVLRANQVWLSSTGLFAEQVVGADIHELFPGTRAMGLALHARARAGERVQVPVHRQVILGQETWWDGSVTPVPMDGGVGLLITAREVGQLPGRLLQEALRETQDLLRILVAQSPSPVALLDRDLRILGASESWPRIVGHRPDAEGRRLYDLLPGLPERFREVHRRCLAGAVEEAEDDTYLRPDGVAVGVSWRCEPWRTARGEVGGLVIRGLDHSRRQEAEAGRHRAEEALARARLAGLDARINEIELVVRPDGTIVQVNDRALAAYGYTREELVGLDIRRIRQADPPALVAGQMALAEREGIRFEAVHVRKDGTTFPVEVSSRAFEVAGERYLHSLVRDLTEQRAATQRIEELAREQQVLLQTAPLGISRIVDRRQVWVNQRMVEMLGYSMEEQIGQTTRVLYPSDEAYEALGRAAYPALAAGRAFQTEQELIRKDGTRLWARYSGMAVDPRDLSRGTIWVLEDITAERAERRRLAETEERLRSIVTTMAEGLVVHDADGRVVSCNAAAERILGLTRDQLEGRTSVDPRWRAIQEDGTPFQGHTHPVMVTLRTGEPQAGVVMGVEAPGQGIRWISISAAPLRLAPGQPLDAVVATFADITERVRSEVALKESLAANERVVAELREVLDHVKTLKGLLPICMYCHKIRDDRGYWDRIEKYIGDRTDASFSHGLCPDCAVKHYPEE